MSNFVKISEAASLGLHTMALLAKHGDRRWTNQEIAASLHGSVHHLAKVTQRLVRAGLIESAVGPQGGFRLARPSKTIRLLEIYEAIEGRLQESGCLLTNPVCREGRAGCVLGGLVQKINREVREYLTKTTLAKLVSGAAFLQSLETRAVDSKNALTI